MEDEGEEEEEDSGESCVLCVVESRVSFRCCAIKKKKRRKIKEAFRVLGVV